MYNNQNYNAVETDTLFLFSLFFVKDREFSLKDHLKSTMADKITYYENKSKIQEELSKKRTDGEKPWISGKISISKFKSFNINDIVPINPCRINGANFYAYYIEFNKKNYGGILLEKDLSDGDTNEKYKNLYSINSYYQEEYQQNSDFPKFKFYEYLRDEVLKRTDAIYICLPTPTKEVNTKKLVNTNSSNKTSQSDCEDVWIDSIKANNKNIETPFFPMLFSSKHNRNIKDEEISKLITGNFDQTIDKEMSNLKIESFRISNNNGYTDYRYYFAPDCDGCAFMSTGNAIQPRTMLQCLNIFITFIFQRSIISSIKNKCITYKIDKKNAKSLKKNILSYKEELNKIKDYSETAEYLPSISGSFAHHLYKKETYDMVRECNCANESCNSVMKEIGDFEQSKIDAKLKVIAVMAIVSIVWDGLSLVEHIFHFSI